MKLHFEPMLLKLGLDLCVPIETKAIAKHAVHPIGAGSLLVCLSPSIPQTDVVLRSPHARWTIIWNKMPRSWLQMGMR